MNTYFSQSFCELERKRRSKFFNLQEPDSDLGSLLLEPKFLLLSSLAQQLSWMKEAKNPAHHLRGN